MGIAAHRFGRTDTYSIPDSCRHFSYHIYSRRHICGLQYDNGLYGLYSQPAWLFLYSGTGISVGTSHSFRTEKSLQTVYSHIAISLYGAGRLLHRRSLCHSRHHHGRSRLYCFRPRQENQHTVCCMCPGSRYHGAHIILRHFFIQPVRRLDLRYAGSYLCHVPVQDADTSHHCSGLALDYAFHSPSQGFVFSPTRCHHNTGSCLVINSCITGGLLVQRRQFQDRVENDPCNRQF